MQPHGLLLFFGLLSSQGSMQSSAIPAGQSLPVFTSHRPCPSVPCSASYLGSPISNGDGIQHGYARHRAQLTFGFFLRKNCPRLKSDTKRQFRACFSVDVYGFCVLLGRDCEKSVPGERTSYWKHRIFLHKQAHVLHHYMLERSSIHGLPCHMGSYGAKFQRHHCMCCQYAGRLGLPDLGRGSSPGT